jgi:hypothetical protein
LKKSSASSGKKVTIETLSKKGLWTISPT